MKILKEVLTYKQSIVALALMFIGIVICFIGGNFIDNESVSFIVVIVGGFVSVSGTTEFTKILRLVRDESHKD